MNPVSSTTLELLRFPTPLLHLIWDSLVPADIGRVTGVSRCAERISQLFLKNNPKILENMEKLKTLFLERRLKEAPHFLPIFQIMTSPSRSGEEQFIVKAAEGHLFCLHGWNHLQVLNPQTRARCDITLNARVETFEADGKFLFLAHEAMGVKKVEIEELLKFDGLTFDIARSPTVSRAEFLFMAPCSRRNDRVELDGELGPGGYAPVLCAKHGKWAVAYFKYVEIQDVSTGRVVQVPMQKVRQIEISEDKILLLSTDRCQQWTFDVLFSAEPQSARVKRPAYEAFKDLQEPPFKFAKCLAPSSEKMMIAYRNYSILPGGRSGEVSLGFVENLSKDHLVSLVNRVRGNRSHFVLDEALPVGGHLLGNLPHFSKWNIASGKPQPHAAFFLDPIYAIEQIGKFVLTADLNGVCLQSANLDGLGTGTRRSPSLSLTSDSYPSSLVQWRHFPDEKLRRFAIVETRNRLHWLTVYDLALNGKPASGSPSRY